MSMGETYQYVSSWGKADFRLYISSATKKAGSLIVTVLWEAGEETEMATMPLPICLFIIINNQGSRPMLTQKHSNIQGIVTLIMYPRIQLKQQIKFRYHLHMELRWCSKSRQFTRRISGKWQKKRRNYCNSYLTQASFKYMITDSVIPALRLVGEQVVMICPCQLRHHQLRLRHRVATFQIVKMLTVNFLCSPSQNLRNI
mmetsp:Transcript_5307/g.10895  ORF Transcript_5307/g.10895 Transcript_5307/m.10895 type:complete len:200 (-) Transcript_5307:51-650(-)